MILPSRNEKDGRALIERARAVFVEEDNFYVSPDAGDLEMFDILLFALGQYGVTIHADQWCSVRIERHGYWKETDDILVGLADAYLSLTPAVRRV